MKTDIFISYSWNDKNIADKIYTDLSLIGLSVLKDSHTINYTDNIKDFMLKIRDVKYAILIISDSYLKSTNCMFEVLQLLKDDKILWNKILPINVDAKFYDIIDRFKYVNFWIEKEKAISETIKQLEPTSVLSTLQELRDIKDISQNIDSFLTNLKNSLSIKPHELFADSYRKLFNRIDIEPDMEKLVALLPIDGLKNPHKKLKEMNNFIKKNDFENSVCYNILGDCYKDLGQKEKAVENYKKSIQLNQLNFSAWNNLGRVYELQFQNFDEAKKAYEKSIQANPISEIPRLNLAVLYKAKYNNIEKATELNNSILEFDENNAKAHSNLASIYRSNDNDKFEKHILVAVNQGHVEALLMYGNYLKVEKKNFDLGNRVYLKARELDKEKHYKAIIDIMLSSNKF